MGEGDRQRSEQLSLQAQRPPGEVTGYEPLRCLGKGAYGEVWLALKRSGGYPVAVKFYNHKGRLDWDLLVREVEKLRLLKTDRYVVQLEDVGWDASPPYYVMEYLERGSLEDLLDRGPLPADRALALVRDVALGLAHAHGKGILHCDLKPANILLGQDLAPRLADFGQARLTHEQSPALGTLFYMAPEQASLEGVPDVRWDVYALGAVLYCALTGRPPFQTDEAVATVRQAGNLREQLLRYRRLIETSPPPAAHRGVAGVDRALAQVIDRALAVNPAKRFPSVHAFLEALDRRARHRARRPLLVVGTVGPALALAVIGLSTWASVHTAVEKSEKALVESALRSNRFAARLAAETAARKVVTRWATVEQEANGEELRSTLRHALANRADPEARVSLQRLLEAVRQRRSASTPALSWFLEDHEGTFWASTTANSAQNFGRDFSWRDYFHGLGRDFSPEDHDRGARWQPITHAHLSMPIQSKSEGNPLAVVFSAPVWSGPAGAPGRTVLGVLGLQAELGEFSDLQFDQDGVAEMAILADTRTARFLDGRKIEGLILEHPRLRARHRAGEPFQPVQLPEEARLAAQAKDPVLADYRDPLVEDESVRWLAAVQPVVVRRGDLGGDGVEQVADVHTGWVVLVQQRYADVVRPVQDLRRRLQVEGAQAFGGLAGLMLALWLLVLVLLNDAWRSRLLPRFLSRWIRLGTGEGSGASGRRSALPGTATKSVPPPRATPRD